jgi:hypothetical protein
MDQSVVSDAYNLQKEDRPLNTFFDFSRLLACLAGPI